MFIIIVGFTSGEKLVDTEVIGYFESYEDAKEYLLEEEYTVIKEKLFDKEIESFILRDVFIQIASIQKLEKMA